MLQRWYMCISLLRPFFCVYVVCVLSNCLQIDDHWYLQASMEREMELEHRAMEAASALARIQVKHEVVKLDL